MAMARRAYYARIRSQPSLRSCCSRVSVRETFSLTGVTCFLPMSYLSHLFAPATAHRFAAWRPFSFRLTIVGAHTQSPARERLRNESSDYPVIFPYRIRRGSGVRRSLFGPSAARRGYVPPVRSPFPPVCIASCEIAYDGPRDSTDLPGSLRDRAPAYRISRIRIREHYIRDAPESMRRSKSESQKCSRDPTVTALGAVPVGAAVEPWPRQLERKLDRNSTGDWTATSRYLPAI